MFRFAVSCLATCALLGALLGRRLEGLLGPVIGLGVVSGALVAAVLVRWATRPDGIRDVFAGGCLDLRNPTPDRIEWDDWALWMTHSGRVDRRTRTLRVERRALLGLLPVESVVKSTREFSQAQLIERTVTSTRRRRARWGWGESGDEELPSHHVLTLQLANGAGDVINLLDLNIRFDDRRKRQLMNELRDLVQFSLGA